ncbi:hypothetical protein [Mariniflexile sp.]|uniref:hypothetical protein n=1 Tax=Mariniflexile sp. TaxID=1979402 RepID=UPI0040476183
MKRSIIIAFLSFIVLTNCSLNTDNNTNQVVKTYWHLTNVSGGVAGIDQDFGLNKIIWGFDEITGKLTVNNTNTDDVEDGLATGIYTYSVIEVENKAYLKIESNEFGGFTYSQTQLIIDQNMTSTGTGADGFIYTFTKVAVVENAN